MDRREKGMSRRHRSRAERVARRTAVALAWLRSSCELPKGERARLAARWGVSKSVIRDDLEQITLALFCWAERLEVRRLPRTTERF